MLLNKNLIFLKEKQLIREIYLICIVQCYNFLIKFNYTPLLEYFFEKKKLIGYLPVAPPKEGLNVREECF